MGGVVSSLTGGIHGNAGGAGLNYSASSANVLNPTTVKQAQSAYDANQQALQQQQAFLQAVQAQNGLQNQSNVYNQLGNIAAGQGPNPAQAMLANATGANVANQAALMAGQRGSNANVGLLARQAANQGAQTQQQAAGQSAALQAQQSLNALQGMGNLATSQANQQAAATGANTQAQQNEQNQLLNSIAQQNNANVGMQSNVNSANAGIAGVAAQQQGQLLGNLTGGIGSAFGLAEGGEIPQAGQYRTVDPLTSPFGQDGQMPVIQQVETPAPIAEKSSGPKSKVGQHLFNMSNDNKPAQPTGAALAGQTIGKGIGRGLQHIFGGGINASEDQQLEDTLHADSILGVGGVDNKEVEMPASMEGFPMAAAGGRVPALVSPGEQYLKPKDVKEVKKGANPLAVGERIPGNPKHPGNDYRNDIVPKTLQSGGIVIPNKIMQSKNPAHEAKKFVEAIMARKKTLPKKSK